jgi:hypothetical protein
MLLNEELLGGGEFQIAVAPPYTKRLNSVAYGGNGDVRYVAVGDEGSIISSSDGKIWFKRVSTTSANLQDVKWISNYNYWLAAGGSNVCYSVDGITWNSWQFAGNEIGDVNKIMQPPYTKDTIWLQNFSGSYHKKQASYSSIISPTGWVYNLNGWVPYIHSSEYDYVTDFMLFGGAAGGGNNTLHYSRNLTSFFGFDISNTGAHISDIAFDNYGGVMLAGAAFNGPTRVVTTVASTDAINGVAVWNTTNNPRAVDFRSQPSLTDDPGWYDHGGMTETYIAYGEIFTDRLYAIWVLVNTQGKIAYATYPITNVGSYYLNNYYSYAIPKLYTNNGLTWTNANVPAIANPYYNKITYGNGQFIAVGSNGLIVISSDGVNWYCKNDNVTKTCVF